MAAATGKLRITYEPLAKLVRHEANPKAHDVDLVASSMRRFGYIDPVVVDERTGKLASGHGRMTALEAMRDAGEQPPAGVQVKGDEWLVPRVQGWASTDDAEAEAALVALNRAGEAGGWQDTALLELLERLAGMDDGLAGVGFDHDEVADLRARLADLPDLDDLDNIEDEFGELDGSEGMVTVKLEVDRATASAWDDVRRAHDTDTAALGSLLGKA